MATDDTAYGASPTVSSQSTVASPPLQSPAVQSMFAPELPVAACIGPPAGPYFGMTSAGLGPGPPSISPFHRLAPAGVCPQLPVTLDPLPGQPAVPPSLQAFAGIPVVPGASPEAPLIPLLADAPLAPYGSHMVPLPLAGAAAVPPALHAWYPAISPDGIPRYTPATDVSFAAMSTALNTPLPASSVAPGIVPAMLPSAAIIPRAVPGRPLHYPVAGRHAVNPLGAFDAASSGLQQFAPTQTLFTRPDALAGTPAVPYYGGWAPSPDITYAAMAEALSKINAGVRPTVPQQPVPTSQSAMLPLNSAAVSSPFYSGLSAGQLAKMVSAATPLHHATTDSVVPRQHQTAASTSAAMVASSPFQASSAPLSSPFASVHASSSSGAPALVPSYNHSNASEPSTVAPGFNPMSAAPSSQSTASYVTAPSLPVAMKIKALLSSGGSFMPAMEGGWIYSGGETRLLTLAKDVDYEGLLRVLSRSSTYMVTPDSSIKYELPGSPEVLVDILNDDDVANMIDEYVEHQLLQQRKFRLHIYVQLLDGAAAYHGSNASGSQRQPSDSSQMTCSSSALGPDTLSITDQQHDQDLHRSRSLESHGTCSQVSNGSEDRGVTGSPRVSLSDLESRIEILRPEDLKMVRFLGAGGYGEVYLAKWQGSNVAVKCLNPSLFTADNGLGSVSQEVVAELLKEAAVLSSLRHPNIVWVYGVVLPTPENIEEVKRRLGPGQAIDAVDLATDAANATGLVPGVIRPPALVTEYMAGGSLRASLSCRAEWLKSSATKLRIAMDAAKGMEYLHLRRIVHFDLKSGNLLIGFQGKQPVAKVADFGLSKQRLQTYVTGVTAMRGTLPWTAPEIIKTPKEVTEKADVYSFGIVLWELWTGREPYEGTNYHALLHGMTLYSDMRPPLPGLPDFEGAEWEGEVPEEPVIGYSELMQRCWQGDPKQRPAFQDIVRQLQVLLDIAKPPRSTRTASAPV